QLARAGDPQFAAAESGRLATKEGAVQARAALLPHLDGVATYSHSRNTGPATQTFSTVDGAGNPIVQTVDGNATNTSNSRRYSVSGSQVLFDFGAFSRVRSQNALSKAADFTLDSAG